MRAFVLVGLPWVPAAEFAGWAARSAAHALAAGADRVSLIPLRADSGALAGLARSGELAPVALRHLEDGLEAALDRIGGTACIVEADLWDAERFADCPVCAAARIARIGRMNLAQATEPPVPCTCGPSSAARATGA